MLLYPLALLYGAIVWLRNRMYDSGFFSSISFSVPVIVVGNLSVGGTGKTPHVEYLIRLLRSHYSVATMSRGYKRHTQGFILADNHSNALRIGDEPMQYLLRFPEIAVSVAEERMTGIPLLLQKRPDVQVVLLDDAFQHRSVKPGLSILITDLSRPFYKDYILPYGTLRESRKAAGRATFIVVSKCPPDMTIEAAGAMRKAIAPRLDQEVFFSTIRYGEAYDFFSRQPVILEGKSLLLVAGIAKPAPLQTYLETQGKAVHLLAYPDHHYFGSQDLEEIGETFAGWKEDQKLIVTTEKDAARLHLHHDRLRAEGWTIAVVPIQVEFLFREAASFGKKVVDYVEGEIRSEEIEYREENPYY